MKIQPAILALTFLATIASAEHAYQGLAEGNPDLGERHQPADAATTGGGADSFDFHHGLSSPDLSPPPRSPDSSVKRSDSGTVDMHHGLSGNPDLSPPPPAQ
ncbi:MAG: hypothetical protein WBG92_14110 [Thiohalocapsa sp.]